MKIDIYIITLWKGTNFAKGSGAYGILLEVVKDGTPYTKEHYADGKICPIPNYS